MSRKPITSGFVWLEYSLVSFNGSGYADRYSPQSFLDSYIAFKRWKSKPEAAKLAMTYYEAAKTVCDYLINTSPGASREPSAANLKKFHKFYKNPFHNLT